ncbi:MAG: glycosyltransferase family 9 protein [Candidatus Rokubacteria bacterium]|nr:glycosyltransferase family 9 protein [Candidatus Rokubacteria bacterium]
MPGKLSVRLPNWLGDTVMAVPALRALRETLVGTEILLAGPWARVLDGQGLADALVSYPRSWRGRLGAAGRVRDFDGDTALLLPNSFEAAATAVLWGARRRVGFARGGRSWLLTDAVVPPRPRLHQADEYAWLVERLDVAVGPREPRLVPPAADSPERERVRALLGAAGAPARGQGPRLVGVHLGAAYGSAKVWHRERVAEFCGLLDGAGDVAVLLGAPEDALTVAEVLAAAPAVSLVGRDSPELLPALLTELDALVSGDTGVAHLAAALGTSAVVLFGPTDPALTAPRGPVAVLRRAVPCAPCFYRVCPIDHPCMRLLEAATVRERVEARVTRRA